MTFEELVRRNTILLEQYNIDVANDIKFVVAPIFDNIYINKETNSICSKTHNVYNIPFNNIKDVVNYINHSSYKIAIHLADEINYHYECDTLTVRLCELIEEEIFLKKRSNKIRKIREKIKEKV